MSVNVGECELFFVQNKVLESPISVFGSEILPQVEEFKCLGILFSHEGRMGLILKGFINKTE